MDCIYCTPEWLEECNRVYQSTPRFQETLKKLTASVFFRVTAEPDWGIDKDIIFGGTVTKGVLTGLRYYSEEEAHQKAELILATSPQQWKLLLRKQHKFITDFMTGKIKLDKGSIAAAIGVAPYADTFIDALTQANLQFQDEMSPQQVEEYRKYASQFRRELGV